MIDIEKFVDAFDKKGLMDLFVITASHISPDAAIDLLYDEYVNNDSQRLKFWLAIQKCYKNMEEQGTV